MDTVVTILFEEVDDGTEVVLTHTGFLVARPLRGCSPRAQTIELQPRMTCGQR